MSDSASKYLNDKVSVSGQVTLDDLHELKRLGVKTVVCNRPDNESEGQPSFDTIRVAASLLRMNALYLPFVKEEVTLKDVDQLANLLQTNQRLHLYCGEGKRSGLLWALAGVKLGYHEDSILQHLNNAEQNIASNELHRLVEKILLVDASEKPLDALRRQRMEHFDVVIVGGGSAGLSVCASILKRNRNVRIAMIEPSHRVYYQPGWTMVGAGVFRAESTRKSIKRFIPAGVTWLQQSVSEFLPNRHLVQLQGGNYVHYQQLIIAAGLELHWDGIEGLIDNLGRNGVTSNYRYDLAPYTWELVKNLRSGNALFTQPPMPIKCAGAPQKAMYLSADHWLKENCLENIDVEFYSAGDSIFGVQDYVPALNHYLDKYEVGQHYQHTLIKIDGDKKIAYFRAVDKDGSEKIIESKYDMIHVCPPQRAPKFVRDSRLSDEAGWLDVNQQTLAHKVYGNIWGLGDVINAPNAKTLAAVRKQVPVVAQNLLNALEGRPASVAYSGYGSCPLTVERGKIVLAEFVYGGKHSPTFPRWLNDGTKPTRFAWFVKSKVLPYVYWQQMMRGIEWFVKPENLDR